MMDLPKEVIIDLLPSYFAGESSAATQDLVHAYFDAHPQFAQAMRASEGVSLGLPGIADGDRGQEAIRRVRKQLRRRTALTALAIFCTVAPFTVLFKDQSVVYFMWRDATASALCYTGIAGVLWCALWRWWHVNPAR